MFLEFDISISHSVRDTFLSTGNEAAYRVRTEARLERWFKCARANKICKQCESRLSIVGKLKTVNAWNTIGYQLLLFGKEAGARLIFSGRHVHRLERAAEIESKHLNTIWLLCSVCMFIVIFAWCCCFCFLVLFFCGLSDYFVFSFSTLNWKLLCYLWLRYLAD